MIGVYQTWHYNMHRKGGHPLHPERWSQEGPWDVELGTQKMLTYCSRKILALCSRPLSHQTQEVVGLDKSVYRVLRGHPQGTSSGDIFRDYQGLTTCSEGPPASTPRGVILSDTYKAF